MPNNTPSRKIRTMIPTIADIIPHNDMDNIGPEAILMQTRIPLQLPNTMSLAFVDSTLKSVDYSVPFLSLAPETSAGSLGMALLSSTSFFFSSVASLISSTLRRQS